jgi:hypothetical protein
MSSVLFEYQAGARFLKVADDVNEVSVRTSGSSSDSDPAPCSQRLESAFTSNGWIDTDVPGGGDECD